MAGGRLEGAGAAGGSGWCEVESYVGMRGSSCGEGHASTILEVMRKVMMKHAIELRGLGEAVVLARPVSSRGQAERRRGPSELASAFLFPNYCLPVPLAAHLEVHLALCF